MIVKSLELNHFRNYESLNIAFDQGTNILYGNNAQGKTNILEAIYLSGSIRKRRIAYSSFCGKTRKTVSN